MEERQLIRRMAEIAREAFEDPTNDERRPRWVDPDDDASVIAWAIESGIDLEPP